MFSQGGVLYSHCLFARAGKKYEEIRKEFVQHIVDSANVLGFINCFRGFLAVTLKSYLMKVMYYTGILEKKLLTTSNPVLY